MTTFKLARHRSGFVCCDSLNLTHMKTLLSFLVLSSLLVFASCSKDNHEVRLKNEFFEQINNIKIGTADIGNVASGGTSAYKSINTGDFTISGTSSSGGTLSGSGTISGGGKHKWTVTVNSSGGISMKED